MLPDPVEEARHHAEVVEKVNELIARGQYGRLFAVVHFASHQWKVTSEDLILIENKLDIACGERIRLEKVLLVGADDFTLLGRPLLGKDLVRVEATVIEKTESWPRVNMRFQKRKNYKRKRSKWGKPEPTPLSSGCCPEACPGRVGRAPALCGAWRPAGGRGPVPTLTGVGRGHQLEGAALGGAAGSTGGC